MFVGGVAYSEEITCMDECVVFDEFEVVLCCQEGEVVGLGEILRLMVRELDVVSVGGGVVYLVGRLGDELTYIFPAVGGLCMVDRVVQYIIAK